MIAVPNAPGTSALRLLGTKYEGNNKQREENEADSDS